MPKIEFIKMHGLGNDFVIIDMRQNQVIEKFINSQSIQQIANRRLGIGCDQVIVITPAKSGEAAAGFKVFNADGSQAEACGNGTRCVAAYLGQGTIVMEGPTRLLKAFVQDATTVTVNMGKPKFHWQDIPLAHFADTQALEINLAHVHPKGAYIYNGIKPVALNIGNPHLVFVVDELDKVEAAILGQILENHPLFPERTNVGFVQIVRPDLLLLKVWERGTGLTLACGTGACAALVAAYCGKSIVSDSARNAIVRQEGGDLFIEWKDSGDVFMTGPAQVSFQGFFDYSVLEN